MAPEVRWNPENGYKNLKVKVECEANEAEAARKAADAELQSRLKDLGSLQAISGRGMEVRFRYLAILLFYLLDRRMPFLMYAMLLHLVVMH